MAETNVKVLRLQIETGTGVLKINGVERSIAQATKATKEFVSSAKDMKQSTNDLGSSAGIAGATVNEFGRLISDMPFGITAVTNNISQLGSLFAVLVTKTEGVGNAFKSLFTTLRASPALAVLLAFQALVAGIEFLAQSSRKAAKSQNELGRAIGESAVELKIALKVLNDNNVSLEEKENLLIKVNGAYENINAQLGENEVLTSASTEAIKIEIQQLQLLAKAQVLVGQAKKLYADLAIAEAKTNEQSLNWLARISTKVVQATLPFEAFSNIVETTGEGFKNIATSGIEEEIEEIIKQLEGIYDKIIKDAPEIAKTLDDLTLKLIQSEIQYLKSIDAITEEHQISIIEKINKLQLEELAIKEKAALKKADEEERSAEEIQEIISAYAFQRKAIINNSNKDIADIVKTDQKKLFLFTKKAYEEEIETLEQYLERKKNAEENAARAVEKLRQENLQKQADIAQAVGAIVSGVADNIDAAYQKEIDIEQNKTTALNNQLRERLRNEQLSADERKNIQNQIAANDEALRVKQEEIEKKQFKANKAAAIAEATISTFLAANGVLSQTKGGSVARIAGMIAVIGTGLANVAMIAKQQFVSSQSSISGIGSLGGGGNQVQAPDFNIVGQSSSNQLAAAVQGQLSQPIKAFVVSKDVTTAQEMDRNIVGSASIG